MTRELYDPLFHTPQENVYEIYAILRSNHPVYCNKQRNVWCLTRYADVRSAAKDWKTYGNAPGVDIDAPNYMGPGNFIDADPPRHDVLRNVVQPFFLPKAIAEFESDFVRHVKEIIEELRERQRVDLAQDFAWRLPIWAISRLLGAPEEDDEMTQRVLLDVFVRHPGETSVPERAERGLAELQAYLAELAAYKRRHPDGRVLSRMVGAEAKGAPTAEETVGMATMFFIAGSETTYALLGNALKVFAENPEVLHGLRQDESAECIQAAIEETLRYETPVQYLARSVRSSAVLHGIEIPEGARLILVWAAANRDPDHWENPDKFDVHRPFQRHVGFGEGIHSCIGAPLARLEARVALPMFVRTFAEYDIGRKVRLNSHIIRGWEKLEAILVPNN